MFLLDSSIVYELRRRRPDSRLLSWFAGIPDDAIFLSVVTLAEIQSWIEPLFLQNPGRAVKFENWANAVSASPQIIPIDDAIIRLATRWRFEKSLADQASFLIGATAATCGLMTVTRHPEYFQPLGLITFNPFQFETELFQNKA